MNWWSANIDVVTQESQPLTLTVSRSNGITDGRWKMGERRLWIDGVQFDNDQVTALMDALTKLRGDLTISTVSASAMRGPAWATGSDLDEGSTSGTYYRDSGVTVTEMAGDGIDTGAKCSPRLYECVGTDGARSPVHVSPIGTDEMLQSPRPAS